MGSYSRTEIERILEKYGNTIYRAAYTQVRSRSQADDIYQNVCMKLLRLKSQIEGEEHLKAWLLKATNDCCKDYWKSAWYRKVTVDYQLVKEKKRSEKHCYMENCCCHYCHCVCALSLLAAGKSNRLCTVSIKSPYHIIGE